MVQVCDAVSGARPGARREVVEAYLTRLKELEDLQARILSFEQTAEQSIQMKQAELFEPILLKIENAINDVAKEKGYTYIFDIHIHLK